MLKAFRKNAESKQIASKWRVNIWGCRLNSGIDKSLLKRALFGEHDLSRVPPDVDRSFAHIKDFKFG